MGRALSIVSSLIIVVLSGRDLGAQERQGFWVTIGLSPGSARCAQFNPTGDPPGFTCSTERKIGPSAFIGAGGTVSQRLLLGVEANGWAHSNPDTVRQYGVVFATLQLYPARDLPFFVKAGFGVGRYAEDPPDDEVLSGAGFAFEAGVGADFRVVPRLTVVPFLQAVIAHGLPANRGRLDKLQEPLDFDLIQLGVGVRWQ